jgi:hypothetical protein
MSPQVTVQVKMNKQQDNKVIKVSHLTTYQQHKRPNPTPRTEKTQTNVNKEHVK